MAWLDEPGFERRPLVFVEDHLYHTADLLAAVAAVRPDLVGCATAVAIDRPGPDTDATIADWRTRYPALQIVAPDTTTDALSFAKIVARLLRPGGILIQDVQLSTLPFLPADRWWESIYLAATVRGLFAASPPTVRFLSNKRGYSATFGRDLLEGGFDPRDVMDKAALQTAVVPGVIALFNRAFPRTLRARLPPDGPRSWPVGDSDTDRNELEETLDLVLWQGSVFELGGRLVGGSSGRVSFRHGSTEADTWQRLIDDALTDGSGLAVVDVGGRIGPAGAERAELTNLAARHMHTLRGRLRTGDAIATINHAYRLGETMRIGSVTPSSHLPAPSNPLRN